MNLSKNYHDISNQQGSNREEINRIFFAFTKELEKKTDSIRNYFTFDAEAYFSNLGHFQGVDSIVSGLTHNRPEVEITRYKITNSYVAVSGNRAAQSAYLMGVFANDTGEEELDNLQFGGHFANKYIQTAEGWKVSEIRFELDWYQGNDEFITHWNLDAGRHQKVDVPAILAELDSPWRVFPISDEEGTDEERIAETYIRYAWALDQADFDLLTTAFTEDAKADMAPFGPMNGRREIVSLLKLMRIGQRYLQHAATNFRVNVTGDTATMDIYRVVPLALTKETLDEQIFGARYESRLRRDQGVWKFEWLHYIPGWIHS